MMTRTPLLATLLAAALLGSTQNAAAQNVSVEIRGSLPKAMGEFSDPGGLEAQGDAGFGADVFFNINPNLSIYGGWGQDGFGCEGCADDDKINSKGFEGGAKLIFGSSMRALPWVRAGVVVHKLTVDRGSFSSESDQSVGFQAGAGVDIPLGEVLSFTPAVRYQMYQAEFNVLGDFLVAQEDISYLTLDLGLHIHLGR